MTEINIKEEEEKHTKALSHYLEKYHNKTGYSNREVSMILDIDRSYYNKIRLQKITPLTSGIIMLKKFAALTNESVFNFLYEMEGVPKEIKDKDNQWLDILKKLFVECGPILRRALIHKRIKSILNESKENNKEKITKIFTLVTILIDLAHFDEWLDLIYQLCLKLHTDLNLEKEPDLKDLIKFIEVIKNKK
nr:hypothetical protein GTC16762_31180 [Pigmentibacter ruber]